MSRAGPDRGPSSEDMVGLAGPDRGQQFEDMLGRAVLAEPLRPTFGTEHLYRAKTIFAKHTTLSVASTRKRY